MAVKYKSRHKTALERKKLRNHGGEWRGNYSSDFDLIGISDEIRFLSLSLSFFPFIVTQTIIKYKNINNLSRHQPAIFQSRKCHNANFWVLHCLKDNNLQPGKIMIYFSHFQQHRQWTITMNCKMELQNFYLHCLLETWSVP